MTPAEERKRFTKKDYSNSSATEIRKWNEQLARTPVFADITHEACDFLEGACNIRYFEQVTECKDGDPRSKTYGQIIDRWTSVHSVRVRPLAREYGGCGVAEYVISPDYDQQDLEYLKRCGMKPQDVQRSPRSSEWHGFLPEEIPEGQRRVIVNLDTLEYIDPVKFGQFPTQAGMVSLVPKDRNLPILKKAERDHLQVVDAAGGLFVMLCHLQRRGGGDITAVGDRDPRAKAAKLFKGVEDGRWRGGRILGTSEIRYEDWPTSEEVLEKGIDISDKVLRYLVAISHY